MTAFNSYRSPSVDASDILPGFIIKKILVGQEKISLTCALRKPRDTNYQNWIGSSEFGQYIKYYFVIVPNMSEINLGKFHYADDRIRLTTRFNDRSIPYASWEQVLGPQTMRPGPQVEVFNPYNFFGFSSISLDEITQGQFFSKDPLSAMENKEIVQYSVAGDSQGFNTLFEVEINYSVPLNEIFEDVNILAFSHIDLASIAGDYGIDITHHLVNIGSDSQFEECLKYSATNGMTVPRTRRAFFTESGVQYRGPVHYHSPDNPGPNGYNGWMSGPGIPSMFEDEQEILLAQNRMIDNGFKLQVREVPNTKVYSRIFAEMALNYEGRPLTAQNSYSGYVQESVLGTLSSAVDSGLLSFGEDIQRTLKAQLGHIPTINDNLSNLYQERLGKLTELSLKKGKMVFQGGVYSDISLNSFSHQSIFFINLGDIISSNSRLGHLYEMHRNNLDNRYSRQFIDLVTYYSKIIDLTVRRIRVTNSQIENNSVSTAIYGIYDTNEEKKLLVKAGPQQYGSDFAPASNSKAEVSSVGYGDRTQTLCVRIVDYDLFDNYNAGRYKYEISMSIEDGILSALRDLLGTYKYILQKFTELVKLASIPYLDYESSGYYNGSKFISKLSQFNNGVADSITRELQGTSGNYNYKTGEFTPAFKARTQELSVPSRTMVEAYVYAFGLMTGNILSIEQEQELRDSLLIENTSLEGLEYFLGLCIRVEKQLEILVESSASNIKETLNLGTHRRTVPTGLDFPNDVISVVGVPNVVAKAFHENALFTQPLVSVSDTQGLATQPAPQAAAPAPNRRRRQRRRVPQPSGAIFTALGVASKNTISNESTISRDGTKNYILQDVARVGAATPPKKKIEINSKIKAAIEISKSAPIFGTGELDGVLDEVKEIENLLISQGGATLETLISDSISDSGSEIDNKNKIENEYVTQALKTTIVESVIVSDNSKEFEKAIESTYKDHIVKKEALGEMYEALKSVVNANKMINSQIDNVSYKEKVKSKINAANVKQVKADNHKKAIQDETVGTWQAFTFDEKGEKVPAQDDGEFGIVVYEKAGATEQDLVVVNSMIESANKIKSQPTIKPKITSTSLTASSPTRALAPINKSASNIQPKPTITGGGY